MWRLRRSKETGNSTLPSPLQSKALLRLRGHVIHAMFLGIFQNARAFPMDHTCFVVANHNQVVPPAEHPLSTLYPQHYNMLTLNLSIEVSGMYFFGTWYKNKQTFSINNHNARAPMKRIHWDDRGVGFGSIRGTRSLLFGSDSVLCVYCL